MSTAHAEALAMGGLAVLFIAMSALALRLRLRKGQKSQWLYVAPVCAVVVIAIMVMNLRGVVFRGE